MYNYFKTHPQIAVNLKKPLKLAHLEFTAANRLRTLYRTFFKPQRARRPDQTLPSRRDILCSRRGRTFGPGPTRRWIWGRRQGATPTFPVDVSENVLMEPLATLRNIPINFPKVKALVHLRKPLDRDMSSAPRGRRSSAEISRGDAAAGTWIFRGDKSRRRRGRNVDLPRRRVSATPGRGSSAETSRGDAAAGTWIFRGGGFRRRRDVDLPRR